MNHRSLKIAVFCCLWGFTGTLVALQVHPYFWWVGMFAGVGGYLTLEFGDVVYAVRLAWHRAMFWKPDKQWWNGLALSFVYSFIGFASLAFIVLAFIGGLSTVLDTIPMTDMVALSAILLGSSLFMTLPLVIITFCSSKTNYEQNEALNFWRKFMTKINLFSICFKHAPRGIYFSVIYAPTVLKKAGSATWDAFTLIKRFVWDVFRLIHSKERILVGVYISFGVAIGYLALGNAIIGGLAAGALAYASREIISKRILKVILMRNDH